MEGEKEISVQVFCTGKFYFYLSFISQVWTLNPWSNTRADLCWSAVPCTLVARTYNVTGIAQLDRVLLHCLAVRVLLVRRLFRGSLFHLRPVDHGCLEDLADQVCHRDWCRHDRDHPSLLDGQMGQGDPRKLFGIKREVWEDFWVLTSGPGIPGKPGSPLCGKLKPLTDKFLNSEENHYLDPSGPGIPSSPLGPG